MTFRPEDLPELRADLVIWMGTQGPTSFNGFIRGGLMPVRPRLPVHEAAQHLATAEARRLQQADLYWATADMTRLALAAGKSLPQFTLQPEDLPSPYGFMVFEEPLMVPLDRDGRASFVNAMAWGMWQPWKGWVWPGSGLWVSWYSDRERNLAHGIEKGYLTQDAARLARVGTPRLSYDNESQVPFTATHVGVFSPLTGEPARVEVERGEDHFRDHTARAAWLLMQQPMTRVTDVELSRAAQKRVRRSGFEPQPVRLIDLRRPSSPESAGGVGREYHHTWIVKGHWRQQWFPSRQVHRPVWIAPHVKGPEGAPLIGGEKVYDWRR